MRPSTYANGKKKGLCPSCWSTKPERQPEEDRTRCRPCLDSAVKAALKYRKKHKPKYNAYMREYMRKYRLSKATPKGAAPSLVGTGDTLPEAPSRDWLLARIEALSANNS